MTRPSPSHQLTALAMAVTAALSAGACSEPSDKKAAATSGVVTTLLPDTSSTTVAALSTTAFPGGPSPTTTVPPVVAPPVAKPVVELRGDDLAVTRVGAPFREAVGAVSGVLGRPSADPTPDTSCAHAFEEVEWTGFRLAATDGVVSGWVSTRKDLKTPSGVTVGTTVAGLRRIYGDSHRLEAPNPDSGWTFELRDVNLAGGLSGSADTDRVTYLFNGSCGPP